MVARYITADRDALRRLMARRAKEMAGRRAGEDGGGSGGVADGAGGEGDGGNE
jgi:hypothetical protein